LGGIIITLENPKNVPSRIMCLCEFQSPENAAKQGFDCWEYSLKRNAFNPWLRAIQLGHHDHDASYSLHTAPPKGYIFVVF
jgi:hypothetical protein